MGDKKPPKRYSSLRIYEWEYEALVGIMANEHEREGFKPHLVNAIQFLIRLYYVYEVYRARTGARNLDDFTKILDEFLPADPKWRVFRTLNELQEALYEIGLTDKDVERVTQTIVETIEVVRAQKLR